jgi:hypothetical protein
VEFAGEGLGGLAMISVTVEPVGTVEPPAGSVPITLPAGSEPSARRVTVTRRPSAASVAVAACWDWPRRLAGTWTAGTWTVVGDGGGVGDGVSDGVGEADVVGGADVGSALLTDGTGLCGLSAAVGPFPLVDR